MPFMNIWSAQNRPLIPSGPDSGFSLMTKNAVSEIHRLTGYRFKHPSLLEESLRHSSFVNEQMDKNLKNNERLEFLGDAVLNLAVSHMLMERCPDINEGTLSRMRSAMVNESRLAEVARTIALGDHICLGKGEMMSGGSEKPSILANTLEALIAAIYLDGGNEVAFEIVKKLFSPILDTMDMDNVAADYKTRLQELIQLKQLGTPKYTTVGETGPDHDKTFAVNLSTGSLTVEGKGKSKKIAEQNAAQKALAILTKECNQN
jgi:ribonuclease III